MWVLLSLFYFLSLFRISEKSENSHHAKIVNFFGGKKKKSLTTMHLVNFYRWFQSTTLSDHLSFFCLLRDNSYNNCAKYIKKRAFIFKWKRNFIELWEMKMKHLMKSCTDFTLYFKLFTESLDLIFEIINTNYILNLL